LAVLGIVAVKMCSRVIKGNQSLGISLLLGIILMYGCAYFFIFDPSPVLCRLRYFFHSISYSICFGVMIAKATQLRNSETIGYDGFISYWNYWLLLCFIVGVQIALNLQWVVLHEPVSYNVIRNSGGDEIVVQQCNWSVHEFLVSHIYVIILLFFGSILGGNVAKCEAKLQGSSVADVYVHVVHSGFYWMVNSLCCYSMAFPRDGDRYGAAFDFVGDNELHVWAETFHPFVVRSGPDRMPGGESGPEIGGRTAVRSNVKGRKLQSGYGKHKIDGAQRRIRCQNLRSRRRAKKI